MQSDLTKKSFEVIIQQFEQHLHDVDYRGYDPFDALNSPFLKTLAFGSRWLGVVYVQIMKRLPVQIRPLLATRKGINPKGWGLLVSAYAASYRRSGQESDLDRARYFAKWLLANPSTNWSGACWGYNFDWPNRCWFYPRGTPTIVNTAFIGQGLLDLYDITKEQIYADTALSSTDFILRDLPRTTEDDAFCFSYTPHGVTRIHNASLLGAALLGRVGRLCNRNDLLEEAKGALRYALRYQRADGSWWYGEETRNHWIDSYHTGYNLLALKDLQSLLPDGDIDESLARGFRYYLDHFFTEEGYVKYFHNRKYPWDAHAAAQALLTLDRLAELDPGRAPALQSQVMERIVDTFWNRRGHCFIYQVGRLFTNRLDYFRWVQCWMFYAFMLTGDFTSCENIDINGLRNNG